MKSEKNIEEEVIKTLNSLDGLTEVKVKPYFYTRLMVKMESKEPQVSLLWNWRIAAMTIVILMNVISLLSLSLESPKETDEAIDLMASEYSLSNTDIYNITLE